MTLEWTITAGVGLMVGISVGILIQLRYVVLMDRKIARVESHIEKIATAILKEEAKIEKMLTKKKPKRKKRK